MKKRKIKKIWKYLFILFSILIISILFIIPTIKRKIGIKEIEESHLIVTTDNYDLKVDYDETGIKVLDKDIKKYIDEQKSQFIKTVEDSKDVMTFKYDFILNAQNVEYKDLVSVNIVTYSYTGGAHYVRQDKTYIYNKKEKRQVSIVDIIKDNESFSELSLIVKHELLKYAEENDFTFDKEWLEEGMNPSKENYEHFYINTDGLTIIFPPYQITSWANGEIKITLVFKDINQLLKEKYQNEDIEKDTLNETQLEKRDIEKYKDKKLVAFTFDDGPNTKTTKRLLDGMAQYDAKATFFVLGNRVSYNQEILKRAYQEGNQIGTHTQNHKNLKLLNENDFLAEVNESKLEIKKVIGVEPTLLRPPYGNIDSHMKSLILMHTILWNVDTLDWKLKDRNLIKEEILKNANDGSIILLHDIYIESVEGALLAMEELEKEGYAFVTIEEMAELKGIKLDYNTSYFNFK